MGQTTEELNAEIAGTRQALASDLDALQDRVSPSAIVERRKVAAKGRMRQIRSRVMGSADSVRSGTSSASGAAASSAREGVGNVVGAAEERVEGSPLAAGLVAFGAGMLVAALLPPTEAEARASQRLTEAAKEHGQPVMDEAKSVGQEMGAQLKESATEAAQQVKGTAQDAASRVQHEAAGSAEQVRSQTSAQ